MRPKDIQQEFDESFRVTRIPSKKEVVDLMRENGQSSSEETSSQKTGLVEQVMQEHGLTRKQAEIEIERFGG